ncbi:MAG TPA: glycosyltransferase [Xanthobacteraceae bacterium]|jgi:ceramide glucosyltransferase
MTGLAQYWPLIPLALWLTVSVLSSLAVAATLHRLRFNRLPVERPAITVIVPVRGVSSNLPPLWKALRTQKHQNFRVLFAVESADDPAYGALAALIGRAKQPRTEIIVAGRAKNEGQKVHNQLAALSRIRRRDRIVVFADADILPTRAWLADIVDLVQRRKALIVSGYRWMVPGDRQLSTAVACAINDAIASTTRPSRLCIAWGGTMALRHEALTRIGIRRWLKGSLNDDLQLTRAAHAKGSGIHSPPHMLIQSPVSFDWRDFLAFGHRQYVQLRIYAPAHWVLGAVAYTVPIVGWLTAIPLAWAGDYFAIGALAAAFAMHQVRASLRLRIPRKLWRKETNRTVALLDRWAMPALVVLNAFLIWSALFSRKIYWGGRLYRIEAPQRVRILSDPPDRDAD